MTVNYFCLLKIRFTAHKKQNIGLNPFLANVYNDQRFSSTFKGYKLGTLTRNGLDKFN